MSGCLPEAGAPLGGLQALADEFRRIARQEAQEAVRAALQDLPGSAPKYTTLVRHARDAGVGVATLRRWARAAGVQRQPNGKFLRTDLERAVSLGGKPPPTPPSPVHDLAAARARRAADALLGRKGER